MTTIMYNSHAQIYWNHYVTSVDHIFGFYGVVRRPYGVRERERIWTCHHPTSIVSVVLWLVWLVNHIVQVLVGKWHTR